MQDFVHQQYHESGLDEDDLLTACEVGHLTRLLVRAAQAEVYSSFKEAPQASGGIQVR